MNPFKFPAELKPSSIKRVWLWMIVFGAIPWIGLGLIGLLFHYLFGHELSKTSTVVGVILFLVLPYLIWVYENAFHAFAVAIIDKDHEPAVDAPNVKREVTTLTKRGKATGIGRLFLTSNERLDHLKFILNRLQSRIGEEYTDITSRITWLMAGQAFLLTAFIAIADADVVRIKPETKYWLAAGVAFTGWVISCSLAISTSLGHALIEKLKEPRDEIEKFMANQFFVPRAGVEPKHAAHRVGHTATRYLPPFSLVAWAGLTFLVLTGHILPNDESVSSQVGWVHYGKPPPPFPIGFITYTKTGEINQKCPDYSEKANIWAKQFLADWSKRVSPSSLDGLVIIGSADRTGLSDSMKRKIDSNMSLARGRAETIKNILMKASLEEVEAKKIDPQNLITNTNAMVLVTAPRNLANNDQDLRMGIDCYNPVLAEDRTVQVWLSKALPQ